MVREDIAASGVINTRVLESMRHDTSSRVRMLLRSTTISILSTCLYQLENGRQYLVRFVVAYMTEQLDPKPTDQSARNRYRKWLPSRGSLATCRNGLLD